MGDVDSQRIARLQRRDDFLDAIYFVGAPLWHTSLLWSHGKAGDLLGKVEACGLESFERAQAGCERGVIRGRRAQHHGTVPARRSSALAGSRGCNVGRQQHKNPPTTDRRNLTRTMQNIRGQTEAP